MRRSLFLCFALLLLAGCGGGSQDSGDKRISKEAAGVTGSASAADKKVIAGWVDALRIGNLDGAASYFSLPSVVANGTPLVKLKTHDQVRAFNASLPCGARLIRADDAGKTVTAIFKLAERPGGFCGKGDGQEARTSFVITKGKIAVWRRLSDQPAPEGQVA